MSDCLYKAGSVITADDLDRILAEGSNCVIEAGAVIRLQYTDEVREGSAAAAHKRIKKHTESKTMQPDSPIAVAPAQQPSEQPPVPFSLPPVAPVPQEASIVQPAAPFDLNALVSATGGNGGIAIVLALVAVVGGTAAWKFWTKISEQKHEQAMRRMELQAEANNKPQQQHPQCVTAHSAFESRIAAVESRIAAAESRVSAVQETTSTSLGDFDLDDLEGRIKRLEKQAKAKPRAPKS